jgi:hypothetical protein
VPEHEPGADVELDEVRTRGHCRGERRQRVLRRKCASSTMADHEWRGAVAP